jgi:hypothetical protein
MFSLRIRRARERNLCPDYGQYDYAENLEEKQQRKPSTHDSAHETKEDNPQLIFLFGRNVRANYARIGTLQSTPVD